MRIVPRPLGGPALSRDYLAGRASRFFPHHPTDIDAFRAKLGEVQRRFGPDDRARAAASLRPTSERAAARLERFVREGGAMVTTGQQAGFLTGPLYTVYKALTTARLAARLEQELGVVVLPVFWTASEDHDWAEVDHAYLGTRRGVHRVQLPSRDDRPLPMSERRLETGVENALDEVRNVLAVEGHTPEHIERILHGYREGETVAGAFERALAQLVAPFDLLLTDAADATLKRSTAPVLLRALEDAARHEALLRERGVELRAAGYAEQVAILEGGTNVFYHGGGERERLYRRGAGFVTASGGRRLSPEEVRAELEAEPERFSPNVLLRPVVESAAFPTLAYVAGPGEIAYYAQLGVLYAEFGIAPPVIYPRFSATLLEGWMERDLARLGLDWREMERPRHELVEMLGRAAMPTEVARALEALGTALSEGYRELIESAGPIDASLTGALGRLRNESLGRLGASERKIIRALKRREGEAIARLDGVRDAIYPLDGAQERTLNVLPFLVREPGLLGTIHEAIETRLEPGAELTGKRARGAG